MLKSCCSCYSFVSFHFSAVHCVVCRLEFQVADKKWCRTSSKVSFDSLKTSVPRGEARAKGSPQTFSVPQASFRTISLIILTYHILPLFHIDCRWGVAFECLGPRLVRPEFGAGKVTVATAATIVFRLYLVIIVQTLTNQAQNVRLVKYNRTV